RLDFAQDDRKWIVDVQHEDPAHHVDDADRLPVPRSPDIAPGTGGARRVIGRAEQPRLGSDIAQRLLLVPNVITRSHHVDAPLKQLVADLPRNAESRGGILCIGNYEVDGVVLDDARQTAPDELAPGTPDDIADEQDSHRAQ